MNVGLFKYANNLIIHSVNDNNVFDAIYKNIYPSYQNLYKYFDKNGLKIDNRKAQLTFFIMMTFFIGTCCEFMIKAT